MSADSPTAHARTTTLLVMLVALAWVALFRLNAWVFAAARLGKRAFGLDAALTALRPMHLLVFALLGAAVEALGTTLGLRNPGPPQTV